MNGQWPWGKWTKAHAAGAFNERLNISQERLIEKIGASKVNALIEQFQAAATADPTLYRRLYAEPDPYAWIADRWAPKQQHH